MKPLQLPLLLVAILAVITFSKPIDYAAAQEIGLTPLEAAEVSTGYSADALKLRSVVGDKRDRIGRISDFIFGKDGNIYVVVAVDDSTGLFGHLVAVPLRQFKLDDSHDYAVLPGASRTALAKLPVYVGH
ncbi:hypothetical protein CK489_03050 [Bradyrhizobium sp. UFLA03-84]|uniref:PRC-barrel domain-containing protein n=1 Tax=Bradyrhizobium sp. UFLA03-84 TaxID=418599 RepID=UPI000BAE4172|nr:PRC-barrel domain-containing protein [Bradyrhizobium sp. UFLA03-84]PAY09588.1 hypothetical protein CK489_03050 [Bradyrhizobium sp. UFLA03-84]